jgi:hypothetical protein
MINRSAEGAETNIDTDISIEGRSLPSVEMTNNKSLK